MTLAQLEAAYEKVDAMMTELPYEEQKRERIPWSQLSRLARAKYRLLKRIAAAKGGKPIFTVHSWICWDASDNNYSERMLLVTTDEAQADAFLAEYEKGLHKHHGEGGAGCFMHVAADGYAPMAPVDLDEAFIAPPTSEVV